MCLDLHHGLRELGHESRVFYGYGSGITEDPVVADQPDVQMLGSRPVVLANYTAHRLIGQDLFTGSRRSLREGIAWADVIQLHAPHHYFMSWKTFMSEVARANKPVLATAHDWWFITGRCGFVEDCKGWQSGCGSCGKRRLSGDLPSLLDRSAPLRRARIASITARGERFRFACPSQHLANDYIQAYGCDMVVNIPNAVDREMEAALLAQAPLEREFYLFSASDLSSTGKIDPGFVEPLLPDLRDRMRFVGRNYPFEDFPDCYMGEIRSRAEMGEILNRSKALVFTSRMDNAPLTILEALFSGTPVVALPSPAAQEMVSRVGGRCVADPSEAAAILRSGDILALYGGQPPEEIAAKARAEFSGSKLAARYFAQYQAMLGKQEEAA